MAYSTSGSEAESIADGRDSGRREHLLKACLVWKDKQKILWAEVKKETGGWTGRWKVRDLLADECCSKD
jgi:hypothetical protein